MAEALGQHDHRIVYVTCGRVYERYCIPMSAEGLEFSAVEARKRQICMACEARKSLLRKEFKFDGCDVSDLVSPEDLERASALSSPDEVSELIELEVDGIAVGRTAAYEFLLNHKLSSFDFSESQLREYRVHLEHTIVTLWAAQRLFERERPDRVLLYNSAYSVNRVVVQAAEQRGITCYFLHAGGNLAYRLQTLMIGRDHTLAFLKNAVKHWDRLRGRPCPPDLMRKGVDYFIELIGGRSFFAYSDSKQGVTRSIRDRFGIAPGQKLLVATLASPDERFSAELIGILPGRPDLLFPLQTDWIVVLKEIIASRPDLFLIIRVHPREFPNKREGVKSEHAQVLEKLLRDLPANARVNWPSDGLSMYDLAEEVDLVLNSWSSVGKEMSLLGIPVLLYARDNTFYPSDLNYVGDTKESYLECIDKALEEGWSADRARKAFRWLAVEYGYALVNIEESFSRAEAKTRPLPMRLYNKIGRAVDPQFEDRRDCRRRAPQLREGSLVNDLIVQGLDTILDSRGEKLPDTPTYAQETKSLKRELARLSGVLFGAAPDGPVTPLRRNLIAFINEPD